MSRQYDLPVGKEMVPDAMPWIVQACQQTGQYSTDDLKAYLTALYNVKVDTPMAGDENRSAWSNYVDWLTQWNTSVGLHRRLGHKTYSVTPMGKELARLLRTGTLEDSLDTWVKKHRPVRTRTLKPKRDADPKLTVVGDYISTKQTEDA